MTSFMYKIRDFSNPRLFIMQFISNKMKVLTLFWDESYHNTSSYHVNKKEYSIMPSMFTVVSWLPVPLV